MVILYFFGNPEGCYAFIEACYDFFKYIEYNITSEKKSAYEKKLLKTAGTGSRGEGQG